MAYTVKNYKTKKALIEDVLSGVTVEVYQPGPFGPDVRDGETALEGPHYPEPHRWYAGAVVKNGAIVVVFGPNGKPLLGRPAKKVTNG